jgi:acetate kinase
MTAQTDKCILVINCGSSSLKFSLYGLDDFKLQISANISGIGAPSSSFRITDDHAREVFNHKSHYDKMPVAVAAAINWLQSQSFNLIAIGHRLVQGGPDHREPERITAQLLKQLNEFIYLAPNHLPEELSTIKSFFLAFPQTRQVACFDTTFHKDLPDHVKYYPLPAAYQKHGMIKYGFHGLSYAYILQKLMEDEPNTISKKIIIAHLGNGASLAAVKNGKCVDTTMGLSPMGGLVMSTRSGDLDPGVILFLLKQYQLSVDELDDLLSKKSGLTAIAGTSDMEEILIKSDTDSKAALAIQVFCYHAKKQIGAFAAALGGLDLLVFTGGIGANSPLIREHICRDMDFIGIELNLRANLKNKEAISSNTSRVSVRALRTQEELMIAKATSELLQLKENPDGTYSEGS